MVSRISNPIIVNTALRNLQISLLNLQESAEIVATGLRIRRPSDDPLGAATVLELRAEITEINRFITNIDRSEAFVNTTEGSLGAMSEILLNLREIAVTGANSVENEVSREAAAGEVDAILAQLIQIANTDFGGRSIFAGFRTETAPFAATGGGVEYRGDDGLIFEEIGPNNVIAINIPGNVVFSTFRGRVVGQGDLDPGISAGPGFDTPLAQLNGGLGVDPGSIVITDGTGASATIDLSAAATIGDVIAAINAAAGVDVTASISETGNSLFITDNTPDPTLPLTITEDPLAVPATTTAADLGIVGSSMEGLLGTDLNPVAVDSTVVAGTLLTDVNFGAGVDQALGTFNITDRDGNTVTVDVSAAVTVGDVVAAINAFTGPGFNVTASIAADGSGIDLTDTVSTGRDQITVAEVGGSTADDLGLLGTGFGGTLQGARLDPTGVASTPISLLARGAGLSLGTIRIQNGELSASIDLSGAITVGNVLAAIERAGVRVDAAVDSTGTRLVITSQIGDTPIVIVSTGGADTAESLGIFAPGIFETVDEVRQALRNDEPARLSQLIGNVDDALAHITSLRTGTGEQSLQMEFARRRLQDIELNFQILRSQIEEADLTIFATQLINNETIYQAALETTLRVISPTIFSFLR